MNAIFSRLAGLAGVVASVCAQETREAAVLPVDMKVERERMVNEQIVRRGVKDARLLEVMKITPREEFMPLDTRELAYDDRAIPIGYGQTISQPYIVAFMTEALGLKPQDRVLEIGTGSGYQAAVLAGLVKEVYTIEIVEVLGKQAALTLERLNYKNVATRIGDGYRGWPEAAPFDAIIVTCAPDDVPAPLVEQLAEGGRMIIPVGPEGQPQNLIMLRKTNGEIVKQKSLPVVFVPMTGEGKK
ncbi:protein-L-isoaspartate(D-aspartate) O-methyltransferase [Luteolibacter rhizosphaerae]|nr:protein-L-isoaspartate(D-aspartate) O-methyltransferase [Luteolibacter rhizosphaerae]